MISCKQCGERLYPYQVHDCQEPEKPVAMYLFPPGRVVTKLEREFDKFHNSNPHIYELFKKYVLQVIERGFQHYSARTIIHRIRWHTSVDTTDPEGFKINNNHSPYYARMFLAQYPQHAGFFRNRKVSGED